jgi:hypothetical protein
LGGTSYTATVVATVAKVRWLRGLTGGVSRVAEEKATRRGEGRRGAARGRCDSTSITCVCSPSPGRGRGACLSLCVSVQVKVVHLARIAHPWILAKTTVGPLQDPAGYGPGRCRETERYARGLACCLVDPPNGESRTRAGHVLMITEGLHSSPFHSFHVSVSRKEARRRSTWGARVPLLLLCCCCWKRKKKPGR